MMGSAESVATAQHFVKERLKEIEARDLPACLPAYLLTCLRLPTYDAHVTHWFTLPPLASLTFLLAYPRLTTRSVRPVAAAR